MSLTIPIPKTKGPDKEAINIPVGVPSWEGWTTPDFKKIVTSGYKIYLRDGGEWPIVPFALLASQIIAIEMASAGRPDQYHDKNYAFKRLKEYYGEDEYQKIIQEGINLWKTRHTPNAQWAFHAADAYTSVGINNPPVEIEIFYKGIECPNCGIGMFLGRRSNDTYILQDTDRCTLCGQKAIFKSLGEYEDLNDYLEERVQRDDR